ncbi:MAG: hypothetical protein V3S11_04505 [Elusimicrobiota bacterium]
MADKVDNLLAALRGEAPPEPQPAPAAAFVDSGAGAAAEQVTAVLGEKFAALEQKLDDMASAQKPAEPEGPPPPQAPTELTLWLQTRIELMEKKLEMAQHEALRANILLREREQAQRKAQREVEDLFISIREQKRSASFDRELREHYSAAQARVRDLEERLTLAQLRMVPAEDVLLQMATDEGRNLLEEQLRVQLAKAGKAAAPAAPESEPSVLPPAPPAPESVELPADPAAPPAPPTPEMLSQASTDPAPPAPAARPPEADVVGQRTAALLGRILDLEHRLDESERLRRKDIDERVRREEDILNAMKQTRRQWQKSGGPDVLVEAALETMVDSLKERDKLQEEMSNIVAALQDEPPDSQKRPQLRARLSECQERMTGMQDKLDKQLALVQAWIERNKGD